MPTASIQPSFAGGILSPALHGRVDLARYDTALKTARNMFVDAHGGISNRPGTEFVCEVEDSNYKHTLIPFALDDEDSLVLVFGRYTMQAIDSGGVVQAGGGGDYTFTTPFTEDIANGLDYSQSLDVVFLTNRGIHPQKLSRLANNSWTIGDVLVDPQITAPTITAINPSHTSGSIRRYEYKVSAIVDGVESFPSTFDFVDCTVLGESNSRNEIIWSDVGADRYNVYRSAHYNSRFLYIGFSEGTSFMDDNIVADGTITPVVASGLFGSSSEWPRAVALHQQRLVMGGSATEPETVFASRTGDFENFTKSETTVASDRMEVDMVGVSLNTIERFMPMRDLVVFTSSGEFVLTGPDNVMTAVNPIMTRHSAAGTSGVKPLLVNDTAIFVDRTGSTVRDLRYSLEADGYAGNDLTIFSPHLFKGRRVREWGYSQAPHSVVWAVMDDGSLLSFTYQREHQVWAWCEHDIGGYVESVAVVPEGGEDRVYLEVARSINGGLKRYIERLHSRSFNSLAECFFVDCGLTYEGAAATTISGLGHLEGQNVVALADGAVVDGLTVSSGAVQLPHAASVVHVGLPYSSEIETLPAAVALQDFGQARGQPHNITRAKIQVVDSRGFRLGNGDSALSQPATATTDVASAHALQSGLFDVDLFPNWNADGTVRVVQEHPLPLTVVGIVPEVSIGRS